MSVAVPHIPGDGRLDTLLDNQLDSSASQLIKTNCLIASEHTTQYIVQMACALLTKLQDHCISQHGAIIR